MNSTVWSVRAGRAGHKYPTFDGSFIFWWAIFFSLYCSVRTKKWENIIVLKYNLNYTFLVQNGLRKSSFINQLYIKLGPSADPYCISSENFATIDHYRAQFYRALFLFLSPKRLMHNDQFAKIHLISIILLM